MSKFNFCICKRIELILIVVLSLSCISALAQNKKPPLTNQDVINMTREKLGESLILQAIKTSETNFDTSANGLIQLKKGKVKKRVIEAIIAKSNSTAGYIVRQEDPPILAPIPERPLSKPTVKPKPIQTKSSQFFTFDLQRCIISGTSVQCFITITNNSNTRLLRINPSSSILIDNSGNQAKGSLARLANAEGTRVNQVLPENVTAECWIRFEKVDVSIQNIALLSLSFGVKAADNPVSVYDSSEIEFKQIPLANKGGSIKESIVNTGP